MSKYLAKFLIIPLLLLLACNKKEDNSRKQNVLDMKEMNELATVEYTLTKVIKATDDKTWFKVGERKILLSCEATIKAGIDMATLEKKNFEINGKHITVHLPQPKVISISIPADKIVVEYEETSGFRDKFNSADRDQLAKQAEVQIRNSIESLGILNQAKVNTSMFVEGFLKQLGYEQIDINYNAPTNNPFSR